MNFKRKIQTLAAGAVLTSALFHGVAMASDSVTVSKGDTLWKLSQQHGTSVAMIKEVNNLKSNTIYAGQKLNLTPAKANKQSNTITIKKETPVVAKKRQELINVAKKVVGVPYKWSGTTPAGFDCSGFMYYTLKSQGLVSSRASVSGYWSQAKKINTPVAGDVVFFQNTYKKGPSHMGIFLGNGQFIHAGSNGVAIDSINSSYWKKHFLGYGTFY